MNAGGEQKAEQIIDLAQWLASAPGQYLRAWSQARCDQASANCFGWHALQLGLPAWPLLRNSRVQRHWVATPHAHSGLDGTFPAPDLALDLSALPFAEASIDLIVLPYALEASDKPHAVLREAARVLVPEGHLLILGFNPASLWGLQRKKRLLVQGLAGKATSAAGSGQKPMPQSLAEQQAFAQAQPLPARAQPWVSQHSLRDWLQLLGLEINGGRFGCYRPIVRSQQWFDRLQWLEAAGDRWWPFLGGVYFLHVIKRVHGTRLLRPAWSTSPQSAQAAAPIARHTHTRHTRTHTPPTCKP